MGTNLFREFVVGIGFELAAHGQPFDRLVAVPAVLVGQHHFHDVAAQGAERGEEFRKGEEVGDGVGETALGDLFRRRQPPPVRFAYEDDPAGAQAPRQQLDGAGDAPADPGRADTGRHLGLLVGDIAGGIAMDEPDLPGDAEFFGTAFRLLGEQPAQVDAGADDAVIPRPGTQHLPRTAAEVEYPVPRFQTKRRPERGELFGGDRVVDAVSAFGDVEYSGDVH